MQSFREIISVWPSPDDLANELGAKRETVRKWRQRDSIPAEWWLQICDLAKARGREISTDELAALAARQTSTPHNERADFT